MKRWGVGLVVTILAVAVLFALPAAAKKKPAPTTTTAPKPALLQAGQGTATTNTFKVPQNWDLSWSYDCSQALGGQGNFIVMIYDYYKAGSQLDLDNQGVNQLGPSGKGVEHYHSGGNTKYLQITSECSWSVLVTKKK
jgi:hypothetical protein